MTDDNATEISSVEEVPEKVDSLEELEDAELQTSTEGDNILSIL